jgi:uncharacterized coiled-coil DUF342 family protein
MYTVELIILSQLFLTVGLIMGILKTDKLSARVSEREAEEASWVINLGRRISDLSSRVNKITDKNTDKHTTPCTSGDFINPFDQLKDLLRRKDELRTKQKNGGMSKKQSDGVAAELKVISKKIKELVG